MKANVILVLANDMDFFGAMCKNFPKEINDYTFIAVNETRIGNKTKEIEKILKKSICNDYRVIDSMSIVSTFRKKVFSNTFVGTYAMGMNILSLWYIKRFAKSVEKVLLLDDDIILNNGLSDIFKSDECMFGRIRLGAGPSSIDKLSKQSKEYINEWFRVSGLTFDEKGYKTFINNNTSSGQRLIVLHQIDLKDYENFLIEFFSNSIFENVWENRRVYSSGYLDERFETFYYLSRGLLNQNLEPYVHIHVSSFDKTTDNDYKKIKKFPIWHNATKSHKHAILSEAIERGILNG